MEKKLTTNSINFAEITGFLNPDGVTESLDEIEYLHVGNIKIVDCTCGRCVRARIRMGMAQRIPVTNGTDDDIGFLNRLLTNLNHPDEPDDWA